MAGGVIAPSGMPQIVARKVTHGRWKAGFFFFFSIFEVENATEIFFLPKKSERIISPVAERSSMEEDNRKKS